MYVCYFDEVKSNSAANKPWYIVGGIVVAMGDISKLEQHASDLAEIVFGSRDLTPSTEFHASNVYFGKGNFKGRSPADRIHILTKFLSLIGDDSQVKRIYAAINSDRLFKRGDAPRQAFMHFCERVEGSLPSNSSAIMIGDLDESQASSMTREFSRYRNSGTSSKYGQVITKIVDSVHFCRSHHSRMIQLADAYVFRVSDYFHRRGSRMGDEFRKSVVPLNLYAHKYKEWPK